MEPHGEGQNQPDAGAQFPDEDGFFYSGPSPTVWAGYLKNQMRSTLRPLPQERNEYLAALRKAQSQPGWQWNVSRARRLEAVSGEKREALEDWIFWNDPEEAARLGRLIQAIRADGEELVKAGLEKLVKLHVYGNRVTSLEPLRGLTSLNTLNLRGNPLEPGALACLRKCKRLGMLDLSNTGLGDISGLEFCRAHILELHDNPDLTGLEVISTMKRLCCLYIDTEVARRYDIQALAPQLIEYGEMDGLSVYVWPEKYYN